MVMMMERGRRDAEAELKLPPGFRFHPTDEELVVHYLCRKVAGGRLPVSIIAEVDLYKFDPWQLPEKALFGQREWYFFTPRDRKYPNGSRPNRAAGKGYWKATGADKPVSPAGSGRPLGIKKALVFYSGKAPRGVKSDWIMHEYRLADAPRAAKKDNTRLDEWVLCRLYNKKNTWGKMQSHHKEEASSIGDAGDSFGDAASDSFHTPEYSEIDNGAFVANFDDMAGLGVHRSAQEAPLGHQMTELPRQPKEEDEWFMGLDLDDLQASYDSFGQVVPAPINLSSSPEHFFSSQSYMGAF